MCAEKAASCRAGRLEGKVAIITGAASGIGRACALLFAREGAALVLGDVQEAALAETRDQAAEAGGSAVCRVTDVSKEEDIKALVKEALDLHGRIDILVNNAGITGRMLPFSEDDPEDWKTVFGVNLLSAVMAVKHAAPVMQAQKKGAIVNVASVAGIRAGAGSNAYSASKAAVINFTQTTACDLGSDNVRVNAVCPGLIETGMTKPVFDFARASGKESKLGARCELKRYGNPMEIAYAVLFLASDEASYITGQALPVDGGNTASLNLPGMKF